MNYRIYCSWIIVVGVSDCVGALNESFLPILWLLEWFTVSVFWKPGKERSRKVIHLPLNSRSWELIPALCCDISAPNSSSISSTAEVDGNEQIEIRILCIQCISKWKFHLIYQVHTFWVYVREVMFLSDKWYCICCILSIIDYCAPRIISNNFVCMHMHTHEIFICFCLEWSTNYISPKYVAHVFMFAINLFDPCIDFVTEFEN